MLAKRPRINLGFWASEASPGAAARASHRIYHRQSGFDPSDDADRSYEVRARARRPMPPPIAERTRHLRRRPAHPPGTPIPPRRSTFAPGARAGAAPRPAARRAIVCAAAPAERAEGVKQLGTAAAAAALALAFSFGVVEPALADVAGLTPCADSKAFAKRRKNEVKSLTKRAKQYEAGSAPALALAATIDRTERRFDNYGRQGLLCGKDGLPHLIADPGLALRYGHAGDVLIPTVGFLYVAGWIGYSGTKYVQAAKTAAKPVDKEIIIDVPLAWSLLWAGLGWPVAAVAELRNGTLLEDDSKITVSPR
jgi:photosystem I subunit 3